MTNDDLCYLSATYALKLFKKRKLSPVELAKADLGVLDLLCSFRPL